MGNKSPLWRDYTPEFSINRYEYLGENPVAWREAEGKNRRLEA